VATGDLASLARLAEQSPRSAVTGLVRALASPPADPARVAELDAFALRTCKETRRNGDPALALTLAATGARRTPAFRMEEALSAFALGRDDVVQEIASADAAVAAALGPLVRAVCGEVSPGSAPAAPGLRPLHAAARAVAHVVRGEPVEARAVVRRIPLAARGPVLADSILLAADLLDPSVSLRALLDLHMSRSIPDAADDVRRAMMAEAALPAEIPERIHPALAQDPAMRRRLLSARMAGASSPGTVAEIVRQVGADAFDAKERGAAELYLGFSQIRTDPGEASRSFDRAVALGADLLEALRGKALAEQQAALGRRPGEQDTHRAIRDAASAADRLARALERTPRAGPLAAAAGKLAAMRWEDAGDTAAALASVARSRPLAGGKVADALDLIEATLVAHRSPEEAEERLDALLVRSPGNVDAWHLKVELAAARGSSERADATLQEAARVTRDPELVARARGVLQKRGQLAPFEGLVPGTVSAGALAKELARTTTEETDPLPLAAALRKALAPAARLAFDAAAIAIAAVRGTPEMAEDRLRAGMIAWRGSPRDLVKLTTVAILVDVEDRIVSAAAAALGDDAAALGVIAEVLAASGRGKLVAMLLPRFAAGLSREHVKHFKSLTSVRTPRSVPGVPPPDDTVREIDRALAPEASIDDLVDEGSDEDEEDDDGFDLAAGGGDLVAGMLSQLEGLGIVPEPKLRQIQERLREITRGPPTPAVLAEIERIMDELEVAASAPRRRKPR
jgi:tetratricopeptide (TPR) repeat protein